MLERRALPSLTSFLPRQESKPTMKIVLDIDKLLADGEITVAEYERFKGFSRRDTGSLAFNVLVGFGVIATAVGAVALLPSALTAIVVGAILAVAGLALTFKRAEEWGLLGSILLLVGSLAAAGGLIALLEGGAVGFLLVTVLCGAGAVMAKSVLLAMIATLALSASVGAMTAYQHASYFLAIRQPTVTIALFTLVGLVAYQVSKRVASDYERLALAVARTSLFLVNLGFWVGSLWGDSLWRQTDNWNFRSSAAIPDWVFVVGWAVGLVATATWGARSNRRWVVNLSTVFGAIHFYTQYFELLGPSPGSILLAGLTAIGVALAIFRYNKRAAAFVRSEDDRLS